MTRRTKTTTTRHSNVYYIFFYGTSAEEGRQESMGSPQHRKTRESISKKIMASLPDFDLLSPSLARSPYPLSQSHSPPSLSLCLSISVFLSICCQCSSWRRPLSDTQGNKGNAELHPPRNTLHQEAARHLISNDFVFHSSIR